MDNVMGRQRGPIELLCDEIGFRFRHSLETAWAIVRETSQVGLAEYILNQMKETRNVIN